MAKRKPFAVYRLLDSEPEVAVVRYDGDPDTFTALATNWLQYEGFGDWPIEPPQPRLYRMNACADYEYSWILGRPDRRGPGVFLGALLTLGKWGKR